MDSAEAQNFVQSNRLAIMDLPWQSAILLLDDVDRHGDFIPTARLTPGQKELLEAMTNMQLFTKKELGEPCYVLNMPVPLDRIVAQGKIINLIAERFVRKNARNIAALPWQFQRSSGEANSPVDACIALDQLTDQKDQKVQLLENLSEMLLCRKDSDMEGFRYVFPAPFLAPGQGMPQCLPFLHNIIVSQYWDSAPVKETREGLSRIPASAWRDTLLTLLRWAGNTLEKREEFVNTAARAYDIGILDKLPGIAQPAYGFSEDYRRQAEQNNAPSPDSGKSR